MSIRSEFDLSVYNILFFILLFSVNLYTHIYTNIVKRYNKKI